MGKAPLSLAYRLVFLNNPEKSTNSSSNSLPQMASQSNTCLLSRLQSDIMTLVTLSSEEDSKMARALAPKRKNRPKGSLDLIPGQRFGNFTVIRQWDSKRYVLRCDCGNEVTRNKWAIANKIYNEKCRECASRWRPLTEEERQVVSKWFPIVQLYAWKFIGGDRAKNSDDLMDAAILALIKAVQTYDPERSQNWKAYLFMSVSNDIKDEFQKIKIRETNINDFMGRIKSLHRIMT